MVNSFSYILDIRDPLNGTPLTGLTSVNLDNGVLSYGFTEVGNGIYKRDVIPAGRYTLVINGVSTGQSYAVGSGDVAALGYEDNNLIGSNASGLEFVSKTQLITTSHLTDPNAHNSLFSALASLYAPINHTHTHDSTTQKDENPSYQHITEEYKGYLYNHNITSGVVTFPTINIVDNSIYISNDGVIRAYDNDSFNGVPKEYNPDSKILTLTGGEQLIAFEVGVGYILTSTTVYNYSNIIPLGRFEYAFGETHSSYGGGLGLGQSEKIVVRLAKTEYYKRVNNSGLDLTLSGLVPSVSAATVYNGADLITVEPFDASVNFFSHLTVANGVWTKTPATSIDTSVYNPPTGPIDLGQNKWSWKWIYRTIGDKIECFYTSHDKQYNTSDAAAGANPPDTLSLLKWHAVLVGGVLFKKGATSGLVYSAWVNPFNISLSGLYCPKDITLLDQAASNTLPLNTVPAVDIFQTYRNNLKSCITHLLTTGNPHNTAPSDISGLSTYVDGRITEVAEPKHTNYTRSVTTSEWWQGIGFRVPKTIQYADAGALIEITCNNGVNPALTYSAIVHVMVKNQNNTYSSAVQEIAGGSLARGNIRYWVEDTESSYTVWIIPYLAAYVVCNIKVMRSFNSLGETLSTQTSTTNYTGVLPVAGEQFVMLDATDARSGFLADKIKAGNYITLTKTESVNGSFWTVDTVAPYQIKLGEVIKNYNELGGIVEIEAVGGSASWNGSKILLTTLTIGESSSTAYRGDRGKTAYDHSQTTGNPHNTAPSDISGLSTYVDGRITEVAEPKYTNYTRSVTTSEWWQGIGFRVPKTIQYADAGALIEISCNNGVNPALTYSAIVHVMVKNQNNTYSFVVQEIAGGSLARGNIRYWVEDTESSYTVWIIPYLAAYVVCNIKVMHSFNSLGETLSTQTSTTNYTGVLPVAGEQFVTQNDGQYGDAKLVGAKDGYYGLSLPGSRSVRLMSGQSNGYAGIFDATNNKWILSKGPDKDGIEIGYTPSKNSDSDEIPTTAWVKDVAPQISTGFAPNTKLIYCAASERGTDANTLYFCY